MISDTPLPHSKADSDQQPHDRRGMPNLADPKDHHIAVQAKSNGSIKAALKVPKLELEHWLEGKAAVGKLALEGSGELICNQVKEHPFKTAAEVGGVVVAGTALVCAGPIVGAVAGAVGATEAVAAAASAIAVPMATLTGMVLAANQVENSGIHLYEAQQKSRADINVVERPEGHSPEGIHEAEADLKKNFGGPTLEALMTVPMIFGARKLPGGNPIDAGGDGALPATSEASATSTAFDRAASSQTGSLAGMERGDAGNVSPIGRRSMDDKIPAHYDLGPVDPQAIDQSNYFAQAQELRSPIKDGFQDGGRFSKFDQNGNLVSPARREIVYIDRVNDPILRDAIAYTKERTAGMTDSEKAWWLNKYVRDLMVPKNLSAEDLSKWNYQFAAAHAGEKIPIGKLANKGVCIHAAEMEKVLGDELGLDITLVRGSGTASSDGIDHAWVEINLPGQRQPLIYDPIQGVAGARRGSIPAHVRGKDILRAQNIEVPVVEPYFVANRAAPEVRMINGKHFPPEQTVSVGSTGDAQIRLGSQGNGVSGQHAYVYTDKGGQAWVADNNSTNGTYLINPDGTRVRLEKPDANGHLHWIKLAAGQKLGLGPRFKAEILPAAPQQ